MGRAVAHSQVALIPSTWNGGVGNWEDPAQWSGVPGIYPNDEGTNYYAATVGGGSATINSDVVVNSLNLAGSLDIGSTASLMLEIMPVTNGQTTTNTGGTLTVANGNLQVDGSLAMQGGFNLNGSLIGAGDISATSIGVAGFTGFDWTAGQINGSGQLTISGLAGITIDNTSAPVSFGGWTIAGAEFLGLTWTGTHDVISTGGGTIEVNGPLDLLADQTFGVPAAPGVAPINISLGGIDAGLVKNSPGTTRLENVIISSSVSRLGLLSSDSVTVSQGTLILDNPISVNSVDVDGVLQAPSVSVSQLSGHGNIQASVSAQVISFTYSPQTTTPIFLNPITLPSPKPVVGSLHIVGNCTLTSNLVSVINGASLAETVMDFNIFGPVAGKHDELDITGSLSFAAPSAPLVFFIGLNFTNYLPQTGDTFDLITFGSLQNFTMPLVACVGLAPGFEFSVTPTANALVFTALNDAQVAPEPQAIVLLPIGFLLRYRIKRTAKAPAL